MRHGEDQPVEPGEILERGELDAVFGPRLGRVGERIVNQSGDAELAQFGDDTRNAAVAQIGHILLEGDPDNDGMGGFIAQRLVKLLIAAERPVKGAKIGIVGIAFKEDVPDLRNSRVPDIVAELQEFGITALVADPLADPGEAKREYGVELVSLEHFTGLDGLILAVPHRVLAEGGWDKLFAALAPGGVLVDVKSVITRERVPPGIHYWSL